MKQSLLELLCEPRTGAALTLNSPEMQGDEIISGTLTSATGASYPIRNGVPRFVSSDEYVGNFSFEWTAHRKTQLDSANGTRESEERFADSLPFPLEELAGRRVLDVGCGMGRFAEIVLKYGGSVVGIDLSYAVDSAQQNLGSSPRANFIQADVFALPFLAGSFDLIYSLGVLHHTPDPRQAFDQLPQLLRPGGILMTTFYAAYNKSYVAASEFWRRILRPLSQKWLYRVAHVSIPLYYIWRLPKIGKVFSTLIPLSQNPDPSWRVLDTFDWYSPRYQFYFTHPEVFRWYQDHGLEQIVVKGPGISLAGTRSA